MCLGVPMQVISIDGIAAQCSDGQREELIDISLTPDAIPGVWLLTFLGASREVLDADEAAKISAALGGLRSLMAGDGLGDAFADLEARGPQLPPHLAAAAAAGKTTG
ncbi:MULTISPECIES: HypC/HybG/HupF family hydrogenase formation chaperone [unclassified Dinoroseobacter]|uniref:HypC/HybG/HupF family hydrogenase formation chaperone n=1 Tax=unclassified Dinoroseobacter TaxID=2620028 RepID=UPI003C7ABB36